MKLTDLEPVDDGYPPDMTEWDDELITSMIKTLGESTSSEIVALFPNWRASFRIMLLEDMEAGLTPVEAYALLWKRWNEMKNGLWRYDEKRRPPASTMHGLDWKWVKEAVWTGQRIRMDGHIAHQELAHYIATETTDRACWVKVYVL